MNQQSSLMPVTPYKGLMPYAEEDAPFFFGREPEREIITANLMAWRLTLLYGPSGVGKSSLLRAGVVHHLHQTARQHLAEMGNPEFAVVVFSAWRDDPLAGLVAGVEDAVVQALETRFRRTRSLEEDGDGSAVRDWKRRYLRAVKEILRSAFSHNVSSVTMSAAKSLPRCLQSDDAPLRPVLSEAEGMTAMYVDIG